MERVYCNFAGPTLNIVDVNADESDYPHQMLKVSLFNSNHSKWKYFQSNFNSILKQENTSVNSIRKTRNYQVHESKFTGKENGVSIKRALD